MEPKRTLNDSEVQYLLSLKPDDIDLKLLQSLFADKYDSVKKKVVHSKFNTYDEFTLTSKDYFVKEPILTNCGLFIFNKFLIEMDLIDVVGYINKPIMKNVLGDISDKIAEALLNDVITSEIYIRFLDRLAWLGFTFNTEVATSLTIKSLKELPDIKKEKERLANGKYKEAIKNKDAALVSQMETELLNLAKKELEDDPSVDLYKSGARGSFNSYKTAQIMKGPIYNEANHEYDIMLNPLAQGANREDIPALANSMIVGQTNKSIAPAECGYLTKKLSAAYQGVYLDKKGSDCHTKGYSVVTLTPANLKFYKYCFIIEGDKLVRLDGTQYDKYMGKTVKMRTNNYCIGNLTCNMCAGDIYYLLGITNVGLTSTRISNSILRGRMKQFHDPTVKTYEYSDSDFM